MHTQKILTYFTLTLIFTLIVTGCGQEKGAETPMPSATSQPIASPTQAPTEAAPIVDEPGFITGRVHGQAPPTPPMVVYAVDNTTGVWSFAETQQTDGKAPFSLQVPPGDYQVFAFSDIGPFAGYSLDGWTLAPVTVASGQTVPDIVVRPPSQSECGATFGLPASPDGRFAAIEGPSQECQDAVLAATNPGDATNKVLPLDVPIGFEFLFGLGEPLMLPPEFPVGEGLPAVQPYVITAEPGEYEISLDYGADCQGAGACHYGSLTGKTVDSSVPVGTRNYFFEQDRAQQVTLAQGIQGYFIESVCGANCSDALLFWIYDGYQYMLGIKAGPQADVVNLANAAIENSIATAPSSGLQPLDPAACGDLANAIAESLGVPATTASAPFEDYVSGQTGTGCQITANGTGLDFENIMVVENALVNVLQAQRWTEDLQHQGGGPGAFLTGYRQADALCLVLAYWEPSKDANCPSDQPIGACELVPEQQTYTITLNCARQ